MDAECTRINCAQQARVLLAYDPRNARAWLRDLSRNADPSQGLILCSRHAERTSVPMSWTLVDERVPGAVAAGGIDTPRPSFDDIFPPRSQGRRDPWATDGADWHKEPELTSEETEEVIANDPAVAPLLIDDDDFLDYDESDDVTADAFPEALPASGTDGVAIPQPQLPMVGTDAAVASAARFEAF